MAVINKYNMAHHEPVCGQRYLNLIPRIKVMG
uniref:Uncharacterized protein n=1 Tax=Siphoviridae sp. cteRK31 TaxID=2826405 RepID=A0A8S5MKC5_9CAUD|nr:MAG TPA: Protein of unknown function (DUF983) [Siphoviridae sp. cteRK31]